MLNSNILDIHIGKPWKLGCEGPSMFDCWGLVVWYYSQAGLKVGVSADYSRTFENNVIQGIKSGGWQPSSGHNGDVAVCYEHNIPTHVGVCSGSGFIYHAFGNDESGQVMKTKIATIKRKYSKVEFYACQP